MSNATIDLNKVLFTQKYDLDVNAFGDRLLGRFQNEHYSRDEEKNLIRSKQAWDSFLNSIKEVHGVREKIKKIKQSNNDFSQCSDNRFKLYELTDLKFLIFRDEALEIIFNHIDGFFVYDQIRFESDSL